jgi:hypothetical protein|tara:strand:+ start:192 stop:443 length:252 start_codon:yes stop_codon:yes gene_type:complete
MNIRYIHNMHAKTPHVVVVIINHPKLSHHCCDFSSSIALKDSSPLDPKYLKMLPKKKASRKKPVKHNTPIEVSPVDIHAKITR